MDKKISIVYQSWLKSHVGFAEAARNYIIALDRLNNYKIKTVALDDKLDNIDLAEIPEGKRLKEMQETEINERPIWITETGPYQTLPNYGYSIGLVVWECREWTRRFIGMLKKQDEIWTPAKFTLRDLKEYGFKNVKLMPHIIDTERFNPKKVVSFPVDDEMKNSFKFLSIMGWSERKGVSVLLKAYLEEFSSDENVLLYIKVNHYDIANAVKETIRISKKIGKGKKTPKIYFEKKIFSWQDFPRVYKSYGDCFVLPSRGEGWGMNYVEAMSMGLPTIASHCCSMPDYINDNNGYLIDIEEYQIEKKCDWICPDYKDMKFPIPSKDHLKEIMRDVFTNREKAKEKGKQARRDMILNYSPEVIGAKMDERLKEIWAKMIRFKLKECVKI